MKHLSDQTPSTKWEYYETPAGVAFNETCVGLRVGGIGDLYLIPIDGNEEKLFAVDVLAGEHFEIQAKGIGASTTCTDITVRF